MKISVIIPTHNRSNMVLQTLKSIESQTLSRADFEVILVDDGSQEEHRTAIDGHQPPYHFTFIKKEQGGLASSRNQGADRAVGDILLFLDDDVVPAPQTFQEHVKSHEASPEPVAVVGSLPFPDEMKRNAFLWYLDQSGHYDLYERKDKKYEGKQPPLPPMNGNSSIPRDTFFTLGKYSETFKQYGGEDLEFGYRLAQAGISFVYNPAAVGIHHHKKNFTQFCRDMEKAGESLIQIYRQYPEIKAVKKIDVVEDPLSRLSGKKKIMKLVLMFTSCCSWMLCIPRCFIRIFERFYALRYLLFPFYRWMGYFHYAVGMRKGLDRPS